MACSPITSWQIDEETMGTVTDYFLARLQQYVNRELPDVQAGFRKGRGTRDQIANIQWIIEKESKGNTEEHLLLLH